MCGICGIVFHDPHRPVDSGLLRRMNDAIVHRGPDDEGYLLEGNVGLAMRRLSIIDIAGGRQPMHNEDGMISVVFNGEIFNHGELRETLSKAGHRFQTRCDTEVLVHLYEEYGEAMLDRLNGMFVFAIFDRRTSRLFVARDRLGVKPLYWWRSDTFTAFGSEIKSLRVIDGFDSAPDIEALHHYLSLRFVPAPATLFRAVKKLPPGHCFTLDVHAPQLVTRQWWDVDFGSCDTRLSFSQTCSSVHDLVSDAVRMRLVAEVPLGMMLSGGVDSAAITAAMAPHVKAGLSTFTIDYEEEGVHREGVWARIVADALQTDHHEIIVGFEDYMAKLDAMVAFMDEPVADPAAIPVWDLCRISKKHVTVLLSGIGGDEIYGGYGLYQEALYRRWLRLLPPVVWRGVVAPLYPGKLPGANFVRRVGRPLADVCLGSSAVYGGFSEAQKQMLYTPQQRQAAYGLSTHDVIRRTLAPAREWSDLHAMMYLDIKHWLADSHLIMMDKMSMAASLEIRTPLLDYRVVEQAARLPEAFKRQFRGSKIVFKQAFAAHLPPAIIARRKQGFSTPIDVWLRQRNTEMKRLLVDREAHLHAYLAPAAIGHYFDLHAAGRGDQSANIFTLLVLERWLRHAAGDTVPDTITRKS